MSANVTVYCLEKVTDYFEFERLCHDLMVLEGYTTIEPLGGFSDKGRDAMHRNAAVGQTTIFAYSVREDWRTKLAEDAAKIKKHNHPCDQMIFITTANFTASERDEAVDAINQKYDWRLELYGLERLRVLLDTRYPQLKTRYPGIFPPSLLAGQLQDTISAHLFISYAKADTALAEWLTRKLTAAGYLVWCERFNLLGGEVYPENVDEALKQRAFRVIALYSQASLNDPEVMRQRALALNISSERHNDFLIPLDVDGITSARLDRATRELVFIPFKNWATGLQQLLTKLAAIHCPQPLPQGPTIAAQTFLERDVLSDQAETLVSNCLPIKKIPSLIHCFKSQRGIPAAAAEELKLTWPYRGVDPQILLSFQQPPEFVAAAYQISLADSYPWQTLSTIHGIKSRHLVSEIIKRSLMAKCYQYGLQQCPETRIYYFPSGLLEKDRLRFIHLDGSKSHVNAVGQRKLWRPSGAIRYRYHLAPVFSVAQNLFDDFVVLVYLRVHLTDMAGQVLSRQSAISRRKHLCGGWWNKQWLDRLLAVCQYFGEDGQIVIGEVPDEQLVISASPLCLNAPQGINEKMLGHLLRERADTFSFEEDEAANEE